MGGIIYKENDFDKLNQRKRMKNKERKRGTRKKISNEEILQTNAKKKKEHIMKNI